MRVRVVLTVEMSQEEWNATYGTVEAQKAIRDEVRYIAQQATTFDLEKRGLAVRVKAEGAYPS